MPQPSPRPGVSSDLAAARAASVRRWVLALTAVWALVLAWRVYGAVRDPAPVAWGGITLPLAMLALFAAMPRKHRRGVYATLMALSFALLGATLYLLARRG
jgi:hypothetical protein